MAVGLEDIDLDAQRLLEQIEAMRSKGAFSLASMESVPVDPESAEELFGPIGSNTGLKTRVEGFRSSHNSDL